MDKKTQDRIEAGMEIHNGNCECGDCDPMNFPSRCPKCGELTLWYSVYEYDVCENPKCTYWKPDEE